MKTARMLALLLLVGVFGSSCSAIDGLNAEYEEEMARVETMSPEEKVEWETAHEKGRINYATNFESE